MEDELTKRGWDRTIEAGKDGEGEDIHVTQEAQPSGTYTEPTTAELAEAADDLRQIASLVKGTGGLLTPHIRRTIGRVLSRPHLRPASLAMLHTRFVRGEWNDEQGDRLLAALTLLGRLMNTRERYDAEVGAQLKSVAVALSPRAGPAAEESLTRPGEQALRNVSQADERQLLTVTEAAKLLCDVVDDLSPKNARARVSKAASAGRFGTNEEKGRSRRIELHTFDSWRLKQRNQNLERENPGH